MKKKLLWKENWKDLLFYLCLFVIFFIWSMMLKFNDAPDEMGRYSICQYIFNYGKLPFGDEMEIRMGPWGFSYAFQPILSYILGAGLMKVVSYFTLNTYFYLLAARFVSVLCGVGMAYFVRKASKLIFDRERYQWLFTVLICLLPQNMFMFVYVNTDSMAMLSTAVIFYGWLLGLKTMWNKKSCVTLGAGLVFCALSYYNAYGFILCSLLVYIVSWLEIKDKKLVIKDWKLFLKRGFLIAGVAFIGAGWWFIRSFILYDGDFLGLAIRDEFAEKYATYEYLKPSKAKTYYNAGRSVFHMFWETDYIPKLAKSFVGLFGNMSMLLTPMIYYGYGILFSLGLAGGVMPKAERHNLTIYDKKQRMVLYVSMVLCILIPIVLCTYSSYVVDYQPQGRYILPMLVPFMYFVTVGIERVVERLWNSERARCVTVTALCVFMGVCVYDFMTDVVMREYWSVFVSFMKNIWI